ncbi:unnamed protein product [Moneuplotes crassus]|uniref:Uncharacterized protein n=1 Tax=Euplotes crassus TaxID=5936 RepID=A0AAD1UQ11_EUPCR|nr:unnamed protein product [Moneuplotes crassus]
MEFLKATGEVIDIDETNQPEMDQNNPFMQDFGPSIEKEFQQKIQRDDFIQNEEDYQNIKSALFSTYTSPDHSKRSEAEAHLKRMESDLNLYCKSLLYATIDETLDCTMKMSAVINLNRAVNNSLNKLEPGDYHDLMTLLLQTSFDFRCVEPLFIKYTEIIIFLINNYKETQGSAGRSNQNQSSNLSEIFNFLDEIMTKKEYSSCNKILILLEAVVGGLKQNNNKQEGVIEVCEKRLISFDDSNQETKESDLGSNCIILRILTLLNISSTDLLKSTPNFIIQACFSTSHDPESQYLTFKPLISKTLKTCVELLSTYPIHPLPSPLTSHLLFLIHHTLTDFPLLSPSHHRPTICTLLKTLTQIFTYFTLDLTHTFSLLQDQLSTALVSFFITQNSEAEEDPYRFDLLNLGGITYYDTVKSSATKLVKCLLESENEEYRRLVGKMYEFCEGFVKVCVENEGVAKVLVEQDGVLARFEVAQVLEAAIHVVELFPDSYCRTLLKESYGKLMEVYKNAEFVLKYRILNLLKSKMKLFLENEGCFSDLISLCEEIVYNQSSQFINTAIEILTMLIGYYEKYEEKHKIYIQENFLSKITGVFKILICNIENAYVEDFINQTIRSGIWYKIYSDQLCENIFQDIVRELKNAPCDTPSLQTLKLFQVIANLLKNDKIGEVTNKIKEIVPEFYSHILEECQSQKEFVSEQLLLICSLMVKNISDLRDPLDLDHHKENSLSSNIWILDSLNSLESVYEGIGCITPEIIDTMQYFCQPDIEIFDQDKYNTILESFIKIGLNELKIQNANSKMHFISGCVYFQILILSMNNSSKLNSYIKIIICEVLEAYENVNSEEKFPRPVAICFLALFWTSLDQTVSCIKELDLEFKIYSMIMSATKSIRYPTEHKIMIMGLINYLESYESPQTVPVFNKTVIENLIYTLILKLKYENAKAAEAENEEEDYIDNFQDNDEDYSIVSNPTESSSDSDEYLPDFYEEEHEYISALKMHKSPLLASIDDFAYFKEFIHKILQPSPSSTIKISLTRISRSIQPNLCADLHQILSSLKPQTKNQLQQLLKVNKFRVFTGRHKRGQRYIGVVHRKIVKAKRRSQRNP